MLKLINNLITRVKYLKSEASLNEKLSWVEGGIEAADSLIESIQAKSFNDLIIDEYKKLEKFILDNQKYFLNYEGILYPNSYEQDIFSRAHFACWFWLDNLVQNSKNNLKNIICQEGKYEITKMFSKEFRGVGISRKKKLVFVTIPRGRRKLANSIIFCIATSLSEDARDSPFYFNLVNHE